jgi:hypothetical protein
MSDFSLAGTATHRYNHDPAFKNLVDSLEYQLHCASWTPSELREAVLLALTNFEMRRARHLEFRDGQIIDKLNDLRRQIDDLCREERAKWRGPLG